MKYIAGANIGYQVVQSSIGPGTHVSANSDIPDHSIKSSSIGIKSLEEPSVDHTGPTGPGYIASTASPHSGATYPTSFSTDHTYPSSPRTFSKSGQEAVYVTTPSALGGIDRDYSSFQNAGPSPFSPSGHSGPSAPDADLVYGLLPPKQETLWASTPLEPTPLKPEYINISPSNSHIKPTPTYLPTGYGPQHSSDGHENSSGWFVNKSGSNRSGLRAHIQNIDLIPLHDRALSPSEALRLDEERDEQYHKNSKPNV